VCGLFSAFMSCVVWVSQVKVSDYLVPLYVQAICVALGSIGRLRAPFSF
jgi:hypothetical protein